VLAPCERHRSKIDARRFETVERRNQMPLNIERVVDGRKDGNKTLSRALSRRRRACRH
jgi:hypothetical protein